MVQQIPDTIRSTMRALIDGLIVILGERLLGVYLGGSVTMGDFCEATSNLDFLVVTDGELSQEDALAVSQLHRELLRQYPDAARLEGDYAPRHLLTPDGTIAPVPGCEKGRFVPKVGEIVLGADSIYNMREQGIACYGPDPKLIFPPVSRDRVREAVRKALAEGRGAAQTPQEASAEFLNLLRSAYAILTGEPTTKSDGAAWALGHLDGDWQPAIQAAMAIRCGTGTEADGELVRRRLPPLRRLLRSQYC